VVILTPARTPADIIAKVNADLRQIFKSPEVVAKAESFGSEVVANTPEEAARMLRADLEQWARLTKERNIKLQ
jgi:tripartite-type tricarboxylate transporter receptor subunit TctC